MSEPVPQPTVCSPEEGWGTETENKSKETESVCGVPTLQNERISHSETDYSTRRLHGKNPHEGRLFLSTDT